MSHRAVLFALGLLLLFSFAAYGQVDPGVRGGAAGAGGPLASVAANNPVNSVLKRGRATESATNFVIG